MVPQNCYVNQQELEPFPCGIRIDYVLYKVRPLPAMCLHLLCLCLSLTCADPLCSYSSLSSLMPGEWES